MSRVVALLLGLVLTVSTGAFANDAPATPKKNDPNAPPPPKPCALLLRLRLSLRLRSQAHRLAHRALAS